MPTPLKVVQPSYYAAFQCIGSACEDSCCEGMGVAIDKQTYAKYESCEDPGLRPIFDSSMHVVRNAGRDSAFAFIAAVDGRCPFLNEDRLCKIQSNLGEEYLSRSCATYPRSLSSVDAVVERSLYLSCPEAARLALLDPEPIRFVETEQAVAYRFGDFPQMDTTVAAGSAMPYHHSAAVRAFVVSILQNRAYALWERLVILGTFCEQLDRLAKSGKGDSAPALIESYSDHVARSLFAETLAGIAQSPAFQLDFVTKIVDERIGSDQTGARFLDCYSDFQRGIGFTQDASRQMLAQEYERVSARYFMPFLDRHGYMLEHFVVNHVFKALFPFGPQQGLHVEKHGFFDEYVILIIQYAVVRSLLVGMAGFYKDELSTAHVVKLIQSAAKTFEHNKPYLKRIRQSLADSSMDSMSALAVLIKNQQIVEAEYNPTSSRQEETAVANL